MWPTWLQAQLDGIRAEGRWRETRPFDALGPMGHIDSRDVVSFASNDYLGLSANRTVIEAAQTAAARWGTGSTASRLIVGTRPVHAELEQEIAEWKQTEAALVFSSGFAANTGVLAVLGGRDAAILSDELNHASIIDGCRLSGSRVVVYRHADVEHLDDLLGKTGGRRIVVTDTVFSMDGDVAPLDALAECCARHDALLVLDEAHAVFGPQMASRSEGRPITVRIGTLSKTLGSLGGWVAGPRDLIDLLVNRSRPFIFTTALTPPDAAAALAALRILRSDEGAQLAARLRRLVDRIRPGHPSPIVPIVLGGEERALAAAVALLDHGVLVPAIRPPTVPPGTSRLRVTVSASHSDEMVTRLLDAMVAVGIEP